jgi:8-oxo-dGTP pyrophosphatase MutT (NUDIX family)
MPAEHWKLVASTPPVDYDIFRVQRHRYRLEPPGAERDFVVLDANDWINVMALTADRQVVLIRQFRHGIRDVTWEVPGGIIETGEPPEEAALRELREETGYGGDSARLLGAMWPNPAMQNNRLFTYLVEGARRVGEPQPDPFERIVVQPRPLADIPAMIGSGTIRHSLVVASFALLGVAAAAPG